MNEMIVSAERIQQTILLIRDRKVILDRDLATLYGVPTKRLKEAVKRNLSRFPADFMFVLTPQEFTEWRSHFATSKADRMGMRYAPIYHGGRCHVRHVAVTSPSSCSIMSGAQRRNLSFLATSRITQSREERH
jgi:hypothetical protein